jgi:Bacteriophage head to tail connecting protein
MTDSRADDIIRRQEKMATDRAVFDSHWREIAERILPRADHFRVNRNPGDKHTERIFDAAAMESMLTPRTQRWHKLKTGIEELDDNQEVQKYLDEVTKILFQVRYAPKANFASQANECYMALGAFGTGAMFTDDMIGRGIRYRSIPLSEIYIAENHQGVVDTVHRRFPMTARQAAQRFGLNKLPEAIQKAVEKSPEQSFDFIHAVCPREDIDGNRKDYRGMPIASCYIALDGRTMLSEGGYHSMPYAVGRYVTGPKEVYGRSPAMTVLPDIKMLNEMSKTVIRAAHKMVDPPLLLQEDGALAAFDLRPGALNYGGVNEQGNQLVHALQTNARVDIGLDMMDQRRKVINDAFLVTLFQILVDAPQMTATEAMLRAQEKGALLAPTMGRQQSEFLGPLIEREIDILARAGALPPMPNVMKDYGGQVEIEYSSPLNRAQRADEGVAIMNTLQAITPLAQIDPKVMMIFNPEAVARELADINGVPAKVMRSSDEIKAMEDAQAQAAQAQQLLAAAPVASGVVKDLAQAQSMAGSSSQQAPGIFPQ